MTLLTSRLSILLALGATAYGAAACVSEPGLDPAPATDDEALQASAAVASGLPECKAQRAVYIVGGNAGLAWFSLVWPAPPAINTFQSTFAYDDPSKVASVGTAEHPLFARKLGTRSVWQGRGTNPQPSVFVAGANETHTTTPLSIFKDPTAGGLMAQTSLIQTMLPSIVPTLIINHWGMYTALPGGPVESNAMSYLTLGAFTGKISAATQALLPPTAAQLARYAPAGSSSAELEVAGNLALAANAFKLGLVNTVMFQAFRDDPHTAFATGIAGPHADHLATMLDEFYADLNASPEPACSKAGQQIKLADNVVTVVLGDTPKNPFVRDGWPDGTPGNANLLYVRSNGFLKPGWFGELLPGQRTNFDPTTGLLSLQTAYQTSTAAAYAGVLYAIARGDKARVQSITSAAFDGVIK